MDRKKSKRGPITPAVREKLIRFLMAKKRAERKKAQEETPDRSVQYDTDLPSISTTTGPELPELYQTDRHLPPAMTGPDEVIYNGKLRPAPPPSFVN